MRKLFSALVVLGLVGLGVFWWITAPVYAVKPSEAQALEQGGDAAKGKVVFYAGGCASCHATPGQDDALKLGGGFALHSDFGTFYAPNISPHPTAGIGKWSVADLANAMISGVSPRGEHYFPAFPFTTYAHARIEDVRDLMAFMRTLPQIETPSKPHDVGFPFNIRRMLGGWKFLFLDRSPIVADASKSAEWNRGRYLTEALGHCAECHSPRNVIGGIVTAQRYAGGPDPEGKGWVPNITQSEKALKGWSKVAIISLLESGMTLEGDFVGGSMGAVIKNMAALPAEDRAAIAEYIKSIPAAEGPARPPKKP